MKKYQIINFHHLLSQIDLQKVDKEARAKLISLDIVLGDIVDDHNAEIEKVKASIEASAIEADVCVGKAVLFLRDNAVITVNEGTPDVVEVEPEVVSAE
jgi:hypothetical protein